MSFLDTIRSFFRRSQPAPQPTPNVEGAEWLVVGLGNPGPKYVGNRHNVGFLATDILLEGEPLDGVAVLKPTTYMNLSGEAVAPLAEALGLSPDRIIVLHDELDLPAGTVRIKVGGNENGHNGLKSITEHLGTRDYVRVRIGIGRPPKDSGVSIPDWVLADFTEPEMDAALERAAQAAALVAREGVQKAQNVIHAE
ncbi:aminoacyl-tRNA hydrolase [Corynebacterium renale]|uniref:Peptidyl-tRNA hydrolase n=1 Tax=Corynebacterium renale TaxID=1724 RepID=A0A2A9DR41_9CORY|nr:aminoacyl-tRNA hydrolase [Corynebacterium renale]PFG29063.1 PTH1 family peptidyl-tRNA hydrolase [Corynebacterium renale]SQI25259.1 Peptidyl-tRNA hydrolase [Corynebacterium renale]